ncbi:uncharacterized protein LOC128213059 [Mya arenaria]|uniref:uncharacterized protein LOC128213059 n=1 Tax=Mya arenaria TaxID=6604 RepID=UPI0022E0F215|nr:uncharacterized protein LOC128213059 [Mya arenaria]
MDERHRSVLERNRGLLLGNIILTDEFFRLLKSEHVLPDTMINDIQSLKTQLSRNSRLLETLRLRGGDAYKKFRHVLYLTGHQMLADHLHGEDLETRLWRGDELFSKFPKVFQHVSDDTKAKILKFLETKVKEKATTNAWLTAGADRTEVMESRRVVFDAEKDYRIKLENKTKKLLQMKDEATVLAEDIKARDEAMARVQQEIGVMRNHFKEDLATQSRFNAANNQSIIHLKDRFDNFNERVKNINIAIRRFLETDNLHVDDDPDNIKISMLEKNVRKIIQVARTNLENTSHSSSEKEAVLSLLRTSTRHRTQTLTEAVQQYVDKQEKGKAAIGKELDMLVDVVRGSKFTAKMSTKPKTDLKYLKTQMAILREEVEHIKKKLEWKDCQISDLIKENSDLKENSARQNVQKTVSFPKLTQQLPVTHASNADGSRDTPDSSREIEQVYQQYDRYVHGTNTPPPTRRPSTYSRRGSLADVNLENDVPSLPPDVKSRRNSSYDSSGLDILGTTPQYRRSISELKSFEGFGDLNIPSVFTDAVTSSANVIMKSPRSYTSVDRLTHRRQPGSAIKTDLPTEFTRAGRRPSLADLITIYENSQDENNSTEENNNNNTRLPVLQET